MPLGIKLQWKFPCPNSNSLIGLFIIYKETSMKSIRTIVILSITGVIVSLGVVAYFMFLGPDRLQFSGKSLPEMLQDGTLLGLLVIPVVYDLLDWREGK
jgi:hypothetical protein